MRVAASDLSGAPSALSTFTSDPFFGSGSTAMRYSRALALGSLSQNAN